MRQKHPYTMTSPTAGSGIRLSKFQQIKMAVAKQPMYCGQRERDIQKRFHKAKQMSKSDRKRMAFAALGQDGLSRLDVLNNVSAKGGSNSSHPAVFDGETGEYIPHRTHVYSASHKDRTRIENFSKLEALNESVTGSLSQLGNKIELRVPKHKGMSYKMISPSVKAFVSQTGCKDMKTSHFYLEQSGWDSVIAVQKYFRARGVMPDDAPLPTDFSHKKRDPRSNNTSDESHRSKRKPIRFVHDRPAQIGAKLPLVSTLSNHYERKGRHIRALQAMRVGQSQQLMALVSTEETKELTRQVELVKAKPRERKRLLALFAREREKAQRLIQNVMADNELVLAAKMVQYGLLR